MLRDTANEMNINNYSITNIELNSVYNQIKYFKIAQKQENQRFGIMQ